MMQCRKKDRLTENSKALTKCLSPIFKNTWSKVTFDLSQITLAQT